ncbi:MAG: response regulator transcription factor [Planctomycetota bacterium]
MPGATILVVEDDDAIRRGLVDALDYGGYRSLDCADGDGALATALAADIDLVLLDVVLPGKDGFEILRELRRARPGLPVIMLTARGSEEDRVRGLKGGADDYVVKPFSAREVLARVEAVLRRSAERPSPVRRITVGERDIDLLRREVRRGGAEPCLLSEREVEILQYLAACRGRAVSREEILQRVWGLDPRGIETRTVDMHIARLREKLDDDPSAPQVIVTVRACGYMLAAGAGIERR